MKIKKGVPISILTLCTTFICQLLALEKWHNKICCRDFIYLKVADPHDVWKYIIILKCGIMYNLFSKFYCK